MGKNILYLENDWLWVEDILPQLSEHGLVTPITSEREFRGTIDLLKRCGNRFPDAVVLEQRVRWAYPSPDLEISQIPIEVREHGYLNAGVRCYEYLRNAEKGSRRTPVIFYSLVEAREITDILTAKGIREDPKDYQFVDKNGSFGDLHRALRRVL